jgi:signal transduction histidine kinase
MITGATKNARILVVDDEPANVQLLERILTRGGYSRLSTSVDSRSVAAMVAAEEPDLLLLDLNMPHLSGYEILEQLRSTPAAGTFLPVIVLTADMTAEAKRRALAAGATDFLTKPFDQTEVLLRIRNVLRTRVFHLQLEDQNAILEERVKERTAALEQTLQELRATQERLVQRERLHALGMMAAGIAHDFNNLLATIMGYGEVLRRDDCGPLTEEERAEYLQTVIDAARDASQIVNRLAQFQRPRGEADVRQTIALPELLEQTAALTKPRWKGQSQARGIDIDLVVEADDAPRIQCDPAEMREMLTNLIFNAVDAMPQGGRITIRARSQGNWVLIEVVDTGTGMTPDVRDRCLEPFFSTKGEHGSGLGLAMIYGIVERHNGKLEIDTAPGRGTTFIIRLPRQQSTEIEKAEAAAPLLGPLDILVVDDQPILCEVLVNYLEGDFHRVETAGSGEQAQALCQSRKFDLLITDKAMPGMTGDRLAAAVRETSPETRVILLTGFGENGATASESEEIDLVVGKPVSLNTLRQAIFTVMSSDAPRHSH